MDEIKITITYQGHDFTFDDELKAYLFHLALQNGIYAEFDFDEVMKYVEKTYDVVRYPNTTWFEDVATFVAENQEKLRSLCAEKIFYRFAEDNPDESEYDDDFDDEEED